jgi:transcriptional regulator with XRE-family HTH domain
MMSNTTPFVLLLTNALERLNLKQTDVAKSLGVTTGYIAMVMKGDRVPSLRKAQEWARVLGVSPQIVVRAITASKAGVPVEEPAPQKTGWFVEFTLLEVREIEAYAALMHWKRDEVPLLIRRIVLDVIRRSA